MISRRRLLAAAGAAGIGGLTAMAEAEAAPEFNRHEIPYTPVDKIPDHRPLMRAIVATLAAYAKKRNPRFLVLGRNAPGLLIKEYREWDLETSRDTEGAAAGKYSPVGTLNHPYLGAIDGILFDGLFYGGDAYGSETPGRKAAVPLEAAARLIANGRRALSVEYCDSREAVARADAEAAKARVLAYIDRDGNNRLDHLPGDRPREENAEPVHDLAQVRDYLPMLSSGSFASRSAWVMALRETNYDLLILDPFWRGSEPLGRDDVRALKFKKMGTDRLVMAYMPMGRARDGTFYWRPDWTIGKPGFLVATDPAEPAQIIVRYWDPGWEEILGRYIQGIVDLGFDGVLFDQLDSYLYFEKLTPLR